MSILLGPYDKDHDATKKGGDDDLLVFGYACKLYRDDSKSVMENSGQLLIPWMGDSSLMVDRYDVRHKLEDKGQFGLKPNLPRPISAQWRELEEDLDMERYLALEWDEIRVEEQEEEEKRRTESALSAVGYVYGDSSPAVEPAMNCNLSLPENQSILREDSDDFMLPPGLTIPEGIQMPSTNKLHSIIEKTALFTNRQGTQMEIIIKTKQKLNPLFSFLNYEDPLFAYYSYLKESILTGSYQPMHVQEETNGSVPDRGKDSVRENADSAEQENATPLSVTETSDNRADTKVAMERDVKNEDDSGSDSDSDDSDGGYLHPLLMKASLKASKPSIPEPAPPPPGISKVDTKAVLPSRAGNGSDKKLTVDELLSLQDKSFVARSMAVNSAPSPSRGVATQGQVTASHETYVQSDALAAYEHYRQQYCGSAHPSMESHHAPTRYVYQSSDSHTAAAYEQLLANGTSQSQYYAQPPQEQFPTPPADLRPIVDKTAEYVAKNSGDFERTVLDRHIGDPRFGFLNPWDPHHAYYVAMKGYFRTRVEGGGGVALPPPHQYVEERPPNVQKLSLNGAVSFKLQPKTIPPSAELSVPCRTHFLVEEEGAEGVNDQAPPPTKKPRVENGDDDDDIGNSVQAFLSTVKGLFGGEVTD